MTTIARFYKSEDAYMLRSFLESEGISAHVFDEHFPQLHWLYTAAIGGIRVVVNPEDAPQAAELYAEYDKNIAAADVTSGEIKYWPVVILLSLFVSIPLFIFGRKPPGK